MRKKTTNRDILKEVYKVLSLKNIDIENKTLMLAFSSGIDSVVLLDVLIKLSTKMKFNLSIAHVNYNLRAEASIFDMLFAIDIAKKNNINIYIEEIEINKYKNKNLQSEARIDRYNFFEKLYNEKKFDYLITAHHRDDLAETIIYKIIKGTGSNVYKSLSKKRGYILRPMLNVYRKDIEKYTNENNLEYREDLSNKENKYSRNKIRNVILPLLTDINSSSKENIIKYAENIYRETKYLRLKVKEAYKKSINNNTLKIEIFETYNKIIQNRILKKMLYYNSLEISEKRISELIKIINSNKNKIIAKFQNKYIVKNNKTLTILESIEDKNNKIKINIDKDGIYNFYSLKIKIEKSTDIKQKINFNDNTKLFLKLDYPFTIRSKNNGDTIIDNYSNNKLKLKKLLIDLKINVDKRREIPIVEKENNIVAIYFGAVISYIKNRISKKSYIDDNTKDIIIMSIQE